MHDLTENIRKITIYKYTNRQRNNFYVASSNSP